MALLIGISTGYRELVKRLKAWADKVEVTGTVDTTLTTTSGTTATATGLPESGMFFVVLDAVSHDGAGGQTFRIEISDDNGSTWGSPITISNSETASDSIDGQITIFNTKSDGATKVVDPIISDGSQFYFTIGTESSKTGVTDALRFSPSSGSFDGGSIRIISVY